MIRFQNILCPVDFFPASQRALEYAMVIARNYGGVLHILHVVSPILPTSYEFSVNTVDLVRQFQEQAEGRVGRMGETARAAGASVETHVPTGEVDEEIRTAIRSTGADIVVMGTHGRRGFERWFMGSVTERALRYSPVPILTMPDIGPPASVPPNVNRILVLTDFSEGTDTAMAYAFALAQEAPAKVTLLHVVAHPLEQAAGVEEVAALLEEHLASMVPEDVNTWCEVEARTAIGTPYQRILEIAEENEVDLIVMNIHGKGMFERALIGATAERVLRGARCPVLAVPKTAALP